MKAIYFLHIPKTAGTSVITLLQQEYGARLCPYRLWDQIAQLDANDLVTYDAFVGHFGMSFVEYIQRPLRIFTILRDPLDRTISHYLHVKRDPNHPYFNVARDMDLRTFVIHPITQPLIYNFQARQLANQALSAMDLVSRISSATFSKSYLAVTWEAASYYRSEGEIRSRAFKALSTLDYVAVTEHIDECVRELALLFGLSNPT